MIVTKYTEEIREAINAKPKVEPWLNVMIYGAMYVIYVWDSRQVITAGNNPKIREFEDSKPIKDNMTKLKGQGTITDVFNKELS